MAVIVCLNDHILAFQDKKLENSTVLMNACQVDTECCFK